MHSCKRIVLSGVVTLALVAPVVPVHAAGLTLIQAGSIVSLLKSFGAEASVLDAVRAALTSRIQQKVSGASSTAQTTSTATQTQTQVQAQTSVQPRLGFRVKASIVLGTVSAVNGSAVTIQTVGGGSRVVSVAAATIIQISTGTGTAPASGSLSDIVAGKTIAVEGLITPSTGAMNASRIRLGIVLPSRLTGTR